VGDPLVGRAIEIGGKTRLLKFTFQALRIAQKRFDGRPVREVLSNLDVDVICELAACGFVHDDKTVSADRVCQWLESEPQKYEALSVAVVEAVAEAWKRMRPEEVAASGEAKAPATGASTTADGPTSPA
jgi:hypothetical protein